MKYFDLEEEYLKEFIALQSVISISSELPSLVFGPGFSNFRFFEFDYILSESFWPVLKALATSSGDSHLLFWVLMPDPAKYYKQQFGRYGVIRFDTADSEGDFANVLFQALGGNAADALAYNAKRVAVYSPSTKWAIWGDRVQEIGVVAQQAESSPPNCWGTIPLYQASDEATRRVLARATRARTIPDEFMQNLKKNYQRGFDDGA